MEASYERIKVLGEGAYGKAVLAQHRLTRELLVIKQIDMQGMGEKEADRTMREARILETLSHPNIIKFKESYKTKSGKLHIVMEYADGGDLARKVREARGAYLPEEAILRLFTQLCLAVKHIHERKIMHRDLKAQNVFLTKEGIVKLGDFGIAREFVSTREKIRTKVGTPYYLSPEICSSQDYSSKTDVWSLGVLLYQMCALQPPFDAKSLPALALKISKGEYAPLPPCYSKDIRKLVADILIVNPSSRPSVLQILKMPIVKSRVNQFLQKSEKTGKAQRGNEGRPLSAMQNNPYSQVNLSGLGTPTGGKHAEINVRKKIREFCKDEKTQRRREKEKGDKSDRGGKLDRREVSEPCLGIQGIKIQKSIQVAKGKEKAGRKEQEEARWLDQVHQELEEIVEEKEKRAEVIEQEMKQSLCLVMAKYAGEREREDFIEERPIDTLQELITEALGPEGFRRGLQFMQRAVDCNPEVLLEGRTLAKQFGSEETAGLMFLYHTMQAAEGK